MLSDQAPADDRRNVIMPPTVFESQQSTDPHPDPPEVGFLQLFMEARDRAEGST